MFGVLSILSFHNLSQYVTGRSAVEQAARKAIRCITPTDPECRSIVQTSPGDREIVEQWYGYHPQVQADRNTSLDFYKYTASIDRRLSTATYHSYEWNMQDVVASWDEVRIPTVDFSGQLNRYASLYGYVKVPSEITRLELRPLFKEPFLNFPPVAVTANEHNHAHIHRVIEIQREHGNHIAWGLVGTDIANQRQVNESDGSYHIIPPSNDKLVVYSSPIKIPKIPNYPCFKNSGEPCHVEINRAAVLDPKEFINASSLVSTAHVAFIPVAVVKNKGSSKTQLRWSENFNNDSGRLKNGLWVEVFSEAGQLTKTYCLGARTTHSFSAHQTIPFNMDIRGPRGSNDGIPGDCQVPKGVGDFSSIKVPRGGSFRIKAMLRRRDDRVGAKQLLANVRFLYWFDQYRVVKATVGKGPDLDCPVMFSRRYARPYCEKINYSSCSGFRTDIRVDKAACVSSWRSSWRATKWVPHCHPVPHSYYIDEKMRKYHEVSGPKNFPICSANYKPGDPKYLAAFSKVCHWNTTENSSMRVGEIRNDCPLASRQERSYSCGKHLKGLVDEKNLRLVCPKLASQLEESEAKASQHKLESLGILDSVLNVLPEVSVRVDRDKTKSSWEFKYTNRYYDGSEIKDKNKIRDYKGQNPKTIHLTNYKQLGQYPEVSKDTFSTQLIHENDGHDQSTYGWDEMLTKTHVTHLEDKIQIDDVWPFSVDSAPRPYSHQVGFRYLYDYDTDCLLDEYCKGSTTNFGSLESALRHFASSSQKALDVDLSNLDLDFSWSETFLKTEQVNPDINKYPECSQYKTSGCGHRSNNKIYLGAEEPLGCKTGEYVNCHSVKKYLVHSMPEYEHTIDKSPAVSTALFEMKRVLPFVKLCNEIEHAQGCASVEIDTSDQVDVRVKTRLNMPISFPLNAIWGDSILLESDISAATELGQLS